jgi:amidase
MQTRRIPHLWGMALLAVLLGCASTGNFELSGRDAQGGFMENGKTLRESLDSLRQQYGDQWSGSDSAIAFMPLTDLAAKIRARELRSLQVLWVYLDRIEELNPVYNAVVTLDLEGAVTRALAADEAADQGEFWGPLHGVPFTIKDTYQSAGVRTTAGYAPYKDHIPQENAAALQKLLEAGAILLGKTNTPTLAYDMQTNNALFGPTNNPWDPQRTPGGSSGGGATALALGMTPFEVGSDLAGSIRLPAAFSGVYGFRPTFGTVSMKGHIPPKMEDTNGLRRMAVPGPLARNAEDLALIYSIIAGPGPEDRRVIPLGAPQKQEPLGLEGLRVAWMGEFGGVPVDTRIVAALERWTQELEAKGVEVTKAGPEDWDYEAAWETWGALVGMQAGYETPNFFRWLGSLFAAGTVEEIPMHRKIVGPTSVEGYMQAMEQQDQAIQALEDFLGDYDVWIVPVSSTLAFPHMEPTGGFGDFPIYGNPLVVNGQDVHYFVANQSYTTVFSLTEGPVISLPIGLIDRLPVGVQLVGRRFEDYRLLEIAGLLSKVTTPLSYPEQSQ